jgi:prepilin-type N-terminal cleavage/methylation domain-containing protein
MVMAHSNRTTRSGFTLIELLVVVAIIALLISILLPSLVRARDSAKQLLCSTNLKTQGEAVHFYAEDNKGQIVTGLLGYSEGHEYTNYHHSLLKYLLYDGQTNQLWENPSRRPELIDIYRTTKLYQCPSFPEPASSVDYVASAFPFPYFKQHSRRDQQGGGSLWDGDDSYRGEYSAPGYTESRDIDEVGQWGTARYILTTEAHYKLPTDETRFHHVFYTSQLPFGIYPRMSNDQRHHGQIVSLFFDGHAEAMTLTKLDSGWPNGIYNRLRYFSPRPPTGQ